MTKLFVMTDNNVSILDAKPKSGDIILAVDEGCERQLKSRGLQYKTTRHYTEPGDSYFDCFKKSASMLRKWGKIKVGDSDLEGTLMFKEFSLWKLLESYLMDSFCRSRIIAISKNISDIIRKECIGVVSCDKSGLPGIAAISIGKRHGLTTEIIRGSTKRNELETSGYKYLTRLYNKKRRHLGARGGFSGRRKDRILIMPSIQTMIPIISPLVEKLKDNPDNDVLVLRYDLLKSRMGRGLKMAGIDFVDFETFATRKSDRKAKVMDDFLKEGWRKVRKCADKNQFSYEDIPFWDVLDEIMDGLLFRRSRALEVARYIECMRNVLENEKPDVVVMLDESSLLGMPTMKMCKNLGIRTISIQHGILIDVGPADVDKKAVWGEIVKKELIGRLYSPGQIVVTGCPKYDFMLKAKDPNLVKKELDIIGRDMILYAIGKDSLNRNYLEQLFSVFAKHPEKAVVIKTHPSITDNSIVEDVSKKNGVDAIIRKDKDEHNDGIGIYDLVNASSLVIIASSMVGVEAILMKKPVIVFKPIEKKDLTGLVNKGVASSAFNEKELENIVNKLLSETDYYKQNKTMIDRFIKDYAYRIDGKSTERVASIIESMAKKKES